MSVTETSVQPLDVLNEKHEVSTPCTQNLISADPLAKDTMESEECVKVIAATLQSPEVGDTAVREVSKLATTIKDIRAANRKIHGDLYAFDQACFRDKHGQPIKLCPQWKEYMNVRHPFTSILSRRLTNSAISCE